MLILNINLYFDPAGVGENLVRAINEHSEHEARHLMTSINEYHPTDWHDIYYDTEDQEYVAELVRSADILHFNNYDWTWDQMVCHKVLSDIVVQNITPRNKVVYHGHGGSWLLDPIPQIKRCEEMNASMVMCGPMDKAVVPNSTWIPNIFQFDNLKYVDWDRDFSGELVVDNASNHNAGVYKGAELIEYMVRHLAEAGHPVRYELVTNMKLLDSLARRSQYHFTVDNWVQGFHGMAGIEGLALGHVVFSRFDPMSYETWAGFSDEMIPIEDVKGFDTCAARIRHYLNDRDALKERCRTNHEWVKKYYTEEIILKRWTDFYEGIV